MGSENVLSGRIAGVLLMLLGFSLSLPAQGTDFEKAVSLSLKGDHLGARELFIDVLKKEPLNLEAKLELAREHYYLKEWELCFKLCKELLSQKKDTTIRRKTYVTYGTALDASGDKKGAVKAFKRGWDEFPTYYLLPFNLGVTYYALGNKEKAIDALCASAGLNPHHPGSAFNLAIILGEQKNRIAGIMALMRFLILEQEGTKAILGVEQLLKKMEGNVTRSGDNQVNIIMDPGSIDQKKENNFTSVDLFLSLTVATFNEKEKKLTDAERLSKEIQSLCSALAGNKEGQKGFFWDFYAPFYISLDKNGHSETLAYIFLSYFKDPQPDVVEWIAANKEKTDAFFEWEKNYFWPK